MATAKSLPHLNRFPKYRASNAPTYSFWDLVLGHGIVGGYLSNAEIKGKELVARANHRLSSRSNRVLVKVNCAALPADLIESELFGREKGAFTGATSTQIGRFELAKGSTILLDEIGELPLTLQAKLLRIYESGEFERLGNPKTLYSDARIITATNRELEDEVRQESAFPLV